MSPKPSRLRPRLAQAVLLLTLPLAAQQPTPPAATRPTTPPPTTASLAGTYDGHQMEVGAQLILKPNGHFLYELAYGALDESAEGTWEVKLGAVYLTTVPAVTPPRFVLLSDTPDPHPGLWITLTRPLIEGARQRIYLLYGPPSDPKAPKDPKAPQPYLAEVADDGHVPLPANRLPTAIIPEIPIYPTLPAPIPLTGPAGHHLTLRFEPNDIGKADFRSTRLAIEDGVLTLPRPDLQLLLHFKRQP